MRVNVNLSEELVKKIDKKAKGMYISRSAYIATALSQKLQADEVTEHMPDMIDTLKKALKEQARQDIE